ncbi:UNVERIFIED_CONTAM: hypothetical protein K2H54_026942 [Gekko kuhli]
MMDYMDHWSDSVGFYLRSYDPPTIFLHCNRSLCTCCLIPGKPILCRGRATSPLNHGCAYWEYHLPIAGHFMVGLLSDAESCFNKFSFSSFLERNAYLQCRNCSCDGHRGLKSSLLIFPKASCLGYV